MTLKGGLAQLYCLSLHAYTYNEEHETHLVFFLKNHVYEFDDVRILSFCLIFQLLFPEDVSPFIPCWLCLLFLESHQQFSSWFLVLRRGSLTPSHLTGWRSPNCFLEMFFLCSSWSALLRYLGIWDLSLLGGVL